MSFVYSISFEGEEVSDALGDTDIFTLLHGFDDHRIEILGLFLNQYSLVGDAAEAMMRWRLIDGYDLSGSGGSGVAAVPLDPDSPATAANGRFNDGTVATSGSPLVKHSGAFNVREGLTWLPPPEARPTLSAGVGGGLVVVRFMAGIGADSSWNGSLYFKELANLSS